MNRRSSLQRGRETARLARAEAERYEQRVRGWLRARPRLVAGFALGILGLVSLVTGLP